MRFFIMIFTLFLLAVPVFIHPVAAETRYVGDHLIITLRQGKSNQHKILKTLETGTPLEVLEEDESYLRVLTTDGIEGYVLRQYISSSPPKAQRIEELERLNGSLQQKIASLEETKNNLDMQLKSVQEEYQQQFSNLTTRSSGLEQDLEQALSNERTMAEKYDILLSQAENVIEIAAERDQLQEQNKKLAAEVATLLKKNDRLADSRMVKWFLAGGGVFLFGWIIGKISRKKRSRY